MLVIMVFTTQIPYKHVVYLLRNCDKAWYMVNTAHYLKYLLAFYVKLNLLAADVTLDVFG